MQPNTSTNSGEGLLDILQLIIMLLIDDLPIIIISLNTLFLPEIWGQTISTWGSPDPGKRRLSLPASLLWG